MFVQACKLQKRSLNCLRGSECWGTEADVANTGIFLSALQRAKQGLKVPGNISVTDVLSNWNRTCHFVGSWLYLEEKK